MRRMLPLRSIVGRSMTTRRKRFDEGLIGIADPMAENRKPLAFINKTLTVLPAYFYVRH